MRSMVVDARIQPRRNLATNPRFQSVVPGQMVEVRRNLATVPDGSAPYGAGGGGLALRGNGSTSTFTRFAGGSSVEGSAGYAHRAFTALTSVNDSGFDLSSYPAPMALEVGQVYTASVYLRPSRGGGVCAGLGDPHGKRQQPGLPVRWGASAARRLC